MTFEELIDINYHFAWMTRMYYCIRVVKEKDRFLDKAWFPYVEQMNKMKLTTHQCDCDPHDGLCLSRFFVPLFENLVAVCPVCRKQHVWLQSDGLWEIPLEFYDHYETGIKQAIPFKKSSSWIESVIGIWMPSQCAMQRVIMTTTDGKKFEIDRLPIQMIHDWIEADSVGSFWHHNIKSMAKENLGQQM